MGKMVMLLRASSKKEKIFLYISYMLDVFFISIVLAIVKLLEDTSFNLSSSDANQTEMMEAGVFMLAIMIIAFFLWLISMEFKGLYDSRGVFNRNVKLMGYPGKKLMLLYIIEMLYMQIPCVISGCALGSLVYHFYAVNNAEVIVWMTPRIMFAASIIHVCMVSLTIIIVGKKCIRESAITEQRSGHVYSKKKTALMIVQLAIAVTLVLVIQKICSQMGKWLNNTDAFVYIQTVKLAYMLVVAIGFAPVMRLIFAVANFIGKKSHAFHFVISLKLEKSYWGRFLVMAFLMIFSGTFFCGLYSLFGTTRASADNLSRESIHYQSYYTFDQNYPMEDSVNDKEYFCTLRYRAQLESGSHTWVTGIDSQYLNDYETFQTTDLTEEGKCTNLADDEMLLNSIDQDDFDGIILPEEFSNQNGKKITLLINNKSVTFTIYASILAHDTDRMDAYVSRAYLQKQLGEKNLYNTVFYLKDPGFIDMDHVMLSQTNEQIWSENYKHIVQGTETMELIFWMILICSIFAICTCLVMSANDNERNLAYLQGIGAGKAALRKIYIFQAIWNVACAVIPTTFLTYFFAKGLGYLLLNPGYYQGRFQINAKDLILLFITYLAVSVVVQLVMVKKTTETEKYLKILRQ